ncbi:hypothetical protein P9Z58_31450, partial [Bacillus cereus]|nr:hypothetical protein [Bacillus cereus]
EEAEQEFFEFVAGLLVHEEDNDKKTSPDWETIRTLTLAALVKLFTAIKDSAVGLVKLFSNAVNLMK